MREVRWSGVLISLRIVQLVVVHIVFPDGSVVKNPPANARDVGSIPGLRISPEEGNGNPLQYSCLGNPMDRKAWSTIVHGAAKESPSPVLWAGARALLGSVSVAL